MTKELKAKIEDYKRFILTLIILSFYFYIGTLITTYIHPNKFNSVLLMLTGASIVASMMFVVKWKKFNKQYQEQQQE